MLRKPFPWALYEGKPLKPHMAGRRIALNPFYTMRFAPTVSTLNQFSGKCVKMSLAKLERTSDFQTSPRIVCSTLVVQSYP